MFRLVVVVLLSIFVCNTTYAKPPQFCPYDHSIAQWGNSYMKMDKLILHFLPSDFPLTIMLPEGHDADNAMVSLSAELFNQSAGAQVFVVSNTPVPDRVGKTTVTKSLYLERVVLVSYTEEFPEKCGEEDPEVTVLACTFVGSMEEGTGHSYGARIDLRPSKNANFVFTVLHELGHVLGLAHDREENSLMFPFAHPTSFTLQDIAYIRGVLSGEFLSKSACFL